MEDVIHATSSHPRRAIAPIPFSQPSAAVATAEAATAKRPRRQPHGESLPPRHRRRPQAAIAAATTAAAAPSNIEHSLFPARRYRKEIPEFVPIRPEAFAAQQHPLAVRTPLDLFRFFPFAVGAAATLAGLSGFLAGSIANRALGGDLSPAYFMAAYLGLFLLNLLTHYFPSKDQLFFVNRRRFLRLLATNALLLLPHFLAYSILVGMGVK